MKKIIPLISFLIIASITNGQIILTGEDYPSIGDAFSYATDETSVIDTGSASASAQIWNYTGLQISFKDTTSFFDPALTPQGSKFSSSDMVTYSKESEVYVYYDQKNDGSILIDGINIRVYEPGFGIDTNINMYANPQEEYLPDTMFYMNTSATAFAQYEGYMDLSSIQAGMTADIFHLVFDTITTNAYGTLITPFDTFQVLRRHKKRFELDSMKLYLSGFTIRDTTTGISRSETYEFWADSIGFPIATVHIDPVTKSIDSVEYLHSNMINAEANFDAEPTVVFVNEEVNFNNKSEGSTYWTWKFGDGNTSDLHSPQHSYSSGGSYSVTLTASNNVSTDSFTRTDYITVYDSVVADFSYTITGDSVYFTNNSSNATSYSWQFGDGNSSSEKDPVHSYSNDSNYEVILSAINPVHSDVHKDTIEFKTGIVNADDNIFRIYPNPAEDQIKIDLTTNEEKETVFTLYNNLGELVLEKIIYSNTDRISLKSIIPGIYFYSVKNGDQKPLKNGRLVIIR